MATGKKTVGHVVLGAAVLIVGTALAQTTIPPTDEERSRRNEARGMHGIVSGQVLDRMGKPFPGIHVVARFDRGRSGGSGEGASTTGPDGRYEIRGLWQVGFDVVAQGPKPFLLDAPRHHVDLTKTKTASGVNFVVVPGPEVHVRVRDIETGEAVEGVEIWGRRPGLETLPKLGTTNIAGDATFTVGLLESELGIGETKASGRLFPIEGDYFAHSVKASSPASQEWTKWVFRPKPPNSKATFRLRAVDSSGHPVSGANVTMRRFQDNAVYSTTTDSNGEASIEAGRLQPNEPEGPPVLWLVEKGELTGEAMPDRTEVWHPTQIVLEKNRMATLIGRLVDENGQPLPGAQVLSYAYFAGSWTQGDRQSDRCTDEQGRFEIPRLWKDGLYYFAFGSSYRDGRLGLLSIPKRSEKIWFVRFQPGETRDLGTIAVPHADHVVEGALSDADGKPIVRDVLLELQGEFTNLPGSVDAKGRFRFEGVVDEPLTLRLYTGNLGVYSAGPKSPDLLLERTVRVSEGELHLKVALRPPQHPAHIFVVPSKP